MRSTIIAGLLSTAYATQAVNKRATEEDFTSAADALISAYIPEDQWNVLTASVADAASQASVTGDVSSIIYSVLKETDAPDWFSSAIPSGYSSEMAALESAIDNLRGPVVVETVIAVTTTDDQGNDVTTSITTSLPPLQETVIAVTTTDDEGNEITTSVTTSLRPATTETTIVTTEATDSDGNTVTTEVSTTRTTTPGSTPTDEEGSDSTSTSSDLACMPTAMAKGAAGVAAMVGLAMIM